jgi:hypothetical protein
MSTEQDLRHPPAPALEAVAAGDAGEESGPIAAHLEGCTACATYVARLKGEAEAFRAAGDPVAFAETIRKRAAARRGQGRTRLVWFAGPVVAAVAAGVLWLRVPPGVDPIATPLAPSVLASSSAPSSDLARFKGGLSVAVIRDRGGRQERLTGPFGVEPSDRIRIEIALDREEPVTAGLLSDDGTWTLLQSPVALSLGTHYSDLSARFDDAPTDAMLLVGPPEAVERARRDRVFEGVVAWHVKSERAGRPREEP